jgi:hypothetical protein
MAATRYCWRCYARQPAATPDDANCARCGEPIAAPAGTSWADKLLWSLSHPLVERRIIAAHSLAELGEPRAVGPLRTMALDRDPYLAAAAVRALGLFRDHEIDDLLHRIARDGPAPARRAAEEALQHRK